MASSTRGLGLLRNGLPDSPQRLLLAHGAGAGMDSPWLELLVAELTAVDFYVVRFEFDYMIARRESGSRRPPDRLPKLEAAYERAIESLGEDPRRWLIGGKSMGGRIASRVADRIGVRGLACFGYPFHPPRQPETLRTAHLEAIETPTLVLQGERDPFGTRREVEGYLLSPAIELMWLGDGDHDLRPRKRSGLSFEGHLASAVERLASWVQDLPLAPM